MMITKQDLEKWDQLARNIASELAIGYNAQVLVIIKTGLAQAYQAGAGISHGKVDATLAGVVHPEDDYRRD